MIRICFCLKWLRPGTHYLTLLQTLCQSNRQNCLFHLKNRDRLHPSLYFCTAENFDPCLHHMPEVKQQHSLWHIIQSPKQIPVHSKVCCSTGLPLLLPWPHQPRPSEPSFRQPRLLKPAVSTTQNQSPDPERHSSTADPSLWSFLCRSQLGLHRSLHVKITNHS